VTPVPDMRLPATTLPILATTGTTRSQLMPELPTLRELGLSDVEPFPSLSGVRHARISAVESRVGSPIGRIMERILERPDWICMFRPFGCPPRAQIRA
jgi:tripartite-type tricarboxylate transporter receptor subunit TctC